MTTRPVVPPPSPIGPAEPATSAPDVPTYVDRAQMLHTWSQLSFIHWRYDPSLVQRLLPAGVTVDLYDGCAWIGLVPFHLTIRPPHLPPIPWVSNFQEMNVRTYVRGPDGVPGIYFLSLDAARLGAVVVARSAYRLPYTWAEMAFSKAGHYLFYSCTRRSGNRPASRVVVAVGQRYRPSELGPLDHFLTRRWRFYCELKRGLASTTAWHEPWPLSRAEVLHCDDELVATCGLPAPEGRPLAHYSPSVDVRLGAPRICD